MSVEEGGRLPSIWTQFWFGALHWLSCGLCSRDSTVAARPTNSDDSSVQSPKLPDIQIIQPGVLCLTDLYTRSHSSEEIQPDAMCLMDLNDDCLLEIIDRLDFEDKLRFRVNRRLKALEPAAVGIAKTEHRIKPYSLICRVDEGQVHFETERTRNTWIGSLPLESGLLMIIRSIKCCRFNYIDLKLPLDIDYLAELFKSLRFLKTRYFSFTPIGTYCPEEQSQHIVNGIISSFRNNEIFDYVRLNYPHTWASYNQFLMLIEVANQLQIDRVYFDMMNLECAQKMGQLLMGIKPTVIADPPRDVSAIRTSIKDKEVYVLNSASVFDVSLKTGARRTMRLVRNSTASSSIDPCFYLCSEGHNYWHYLVRVPYSQPEQ